MDIAKEQMKNDLWIRVEITVKRRRRIQEEMKPRRWVVEGVKERSG
jgi:hypothetical protein